MKIKQSTFLTSSKNPKQCPPEDLPEYAFIGRSNVGKSSLINMLTKRKSLAKISGTPGKTRLINHFLIDNSWYLVDLPGYGYAKGGKDDKRNFTDFVRTYIQNRRNLMCLFVLIDCRLPLQKVDDEFMAWLGKHEVPFVIVYTKNDKLGKMKLKSNIEVIERDLLKKWAELPQRFSTSSLKAEGRDEICDFIGLTNHYFQMPENVEKSERK